MKPLPLVAFILLGLLGRLPAAGPIAAFTPGARILFQGDSITDGNRGRSADPNHILGHGYVFIIAAQYGAAFAALDLQFLNRGSSGNTVRELQKRWGKDTLELKPDLLMAERSRDLCPVFECERGEGRGVGHFRALTKRRPAGTPRHPWILLFPSSARLVGCRERLQPRS